MTALRALVVAVGLLVIWQAIVSIFQPPPFLLPAPARVFAALVDAAGPLAGACGDDAHRDRDRPGRGHARSAPASRWP